MSLNDRVALVTGAGSGIGKAAALLFARKGAKVGLLARRAETLSATAAEIETQGGQAIPLPADVSQPEQMRNAVEQLISQWGRLDVVFANAGINGVWAPIEELEPEEWDRTLNTNLKGTYLTIKYSLPHMKEHGGSIIVNSSVNGTRTFSNPGVTAYACSKAGQVALTKIMALELAQYRIRVNVICPGAVDTEIENSTEKRHLERVRVQVRFPEGSRPQIRWGAGTPEQVAELVFFLASDASDHISGAQIFIDGGYSLL